MLTIFIVNLNTHWVYKDCQFNNFFLVKITGSFPFGAVVQPEEICKALASVVMKIFPIPISFTPTSFILLTLYSPQERTIPLHALWTSFSQQLCTTTKQPFSCLVCRNLQACVPCQPLPAFYLFGRLLWFGNMLWSFFMMLKYIITVFNLTNALS